MIAWCCDISVLSLSVYFWRKIGDHNQSVLEILISVAGISVKDELDRKIDQSPSRVISYPEGQKPTLRTTSRPISAQSSCFTNDSNESARLESAPPSLAVFPIQSNSSGFALQRRIVSPQSTTLSAILEKNTESALTVLPNDRGSQASQVAYPRSVSWQSHMEQLG